MRRPILAFLIALQATGVGCARTNGIGVGSGSRLLGSGSGVATTKIGVGGYTVGS